MSKKKAQSIKPGPDKVQTIENLKAKMKGLKKTSAEYKKFSKALELIEKTWK